MSSRTRLFAAGAAFGLFFFGASLEAGEVIDRILVHINSRVVTQSTFDTRVQQAIRDGGTPADTARLEELRKSVFLELLHEALLEDRARDLDLATTDADVEDQIRRLKEQNQVASDADFEKALSASGLTVESLRAQLKKSLTVQRVVGREVNSKVDLSDDALRVIYEREKDTWKIPEQVRVAEVLISVEDDPASRASGERRAREASDKQKQGMKFDTLVSLYSDGPTRGRGGELGFISRGELNIDIEKVAFSLPIGEVSEPIPTKHGWHILKVLEKKPVAYKPFAEVKGDLLKREQETQFQKKLAEYLEKLKRDAVIRVAPEAAPYYSGAPSTAVSAVKAS